MDTTHKHTSNPSKPASDHGFFPGALAALQNNYGRQQATSRPDRGVPVWRYGSGYDSVRAGTLVFIIECSYPGDHPDAGWVRVLLPGGECVSCYKRNLRRTDTGTDTDVECVSSMTHL
jgi:hypothetical protein